MLNAASRLKGEKDWQKYETARKLNKSVDKIRESYRDDFKSKEMRIRQRAVAMYFIDKVSCCTVMVEAGGDRHITVKNDQIVVVKANVMIFR